MIYLDSVAIVKLVHAEAETEELREWLDSRSDIGWLSSAISEVEVFRAVARHAPSAVVRLPQVFDLIAMVEVNADIRARARTVQPATVRSLDAIHLATAQSLGSKLTSFVTYDNRLAEAAREVHFNAASPGAAPR